MAVIEVLLAIALGFLMILCVRQAWRHFKTENYARGLLRSIVAGFIFLILTVSEGYPGAACIKDTLLFCRLTGHVGMPSRIRSGHSNDFNFTGDGYSYRIWQVPERLRARFYNFSPADRPALGILSQDWERQIWKPTPASSAGVGYSDKSFGPELDRLLEQRGNLWCMTRNPTGDAQEIVVLDPRTGRMIYFECSH